MVGGLIIEYLMLISTIVLIVLRLFSIQWLVAGVSSLAPAIMELSLKIGMHNGSFSAADLIMSLAMLLLGVVSWVVAPVLARLVAGKSDAPVAISGLSLQDLYAFAFVFLGLYFVLHSLADFLYRFYYAFLAAASLGDFDPERKQSLKNLSRPLITFVAGLVCLFYGRKWARKLSGTEKEN